jgi:hypothetical protein
VGNPRPVHLLAQGVFAACQQFSFCRNGDFGWDFSDWTAICGMGGSS